ncbi:F-box/kelch-repeat protein At3g23880-like [Diospyros lotus]|uniref:F-box/kelch-repeat protein At3g23880-like n=1 Tax=Diospyros lotus TaxID=55363 RepID=UPI00225A7DDA|nr:F-box/kelch-repeat protein At3g23880-like [Diospyros lotus]
MQPALMANPQNPNLPGDSQPLLIIPQEIIVEILFRLPVRSLLKFKSVCKSWRSLISDPKFVKTHLTLSSAANDGTHSRLMIRYVGPYFGLKSCYLYSLFDKQTPNVVDLNYPLENTYRTAWFVGSSNGLVCIATDEFKLCVWNPSTGKSKIFSGFNVRLLLNLRIKYGFAYDESIDDYKVVSIFDVEGKLSSFETEVYTLGTSSWRRIGKFPCGGPLSLTGKFANGALHWFSTGNPYEIFPTVICSLNLSSETYGKIALPSFGGRCSGVRLDVLDGSLCVICNNAGSHADLWVLKEYGIEESWTKLFVIPYPTSPFSGVYSRPFCSLKNGELLMDFKSRLAVYNPKDGIIRYLDIQNYETFYEVCPYVESLVSVGADNLTQGQHP